VPHQLRHSYGTEMTRAGVSLPAVMTLLVHLKPEMSLHYVEVSLVDLECEFLLARSQPRHLVPTSRLPASPASRQAILPVCSTRCMSLATFWKYFAARFPKDANAVSSAASPIA
jgi:hypothetical protein